MLYSDEEDVIMIYLWWRNRQRRKRAPPRQWVSDFLQKRNLKGGYQTLVKEIEEHDVDRHFHFHRMTPEKFNFILEKIKPLITRKNFIRESLPPDLRLSLTLRYLASGDSMISLHYLYRVSQTSITRLIPDTCNAIWQVLAPDVIKMPSSEEEWAKIAKDFENGWDFPHCIGAIDGKHVIAQICNNASSSSIVLMAMCDAHYRFTFASIGAAGRGDSTVFETSSLGKMILGNTLPLPRPRLLTGSNFVAPYVFVGDASFSLRENVMRPYAGQNIHASKVIFNYRLSRARRVVENTFGVLVSRFRIFQKPIKASLSTVESVVKAAVALHNFLQTAETNQAPSERLYMPPGLVDTEDKDGNVEPGSWRADAESANGLEDIAATKSRNPTVRAVDVQNSFRDYFMTNGQVPSQWNKIPTQDKF